MGMNEGTVSLFLLLLALFLSVLLKVYALVEEGDKIREKETTNTHMNI
jgi:hypothetical protein